MLMSNKLTQIKLVILNIKKKLEYYLNKKLFKNTKKHIIPLSNQLKFFNILHDVTTADKLA